MVRGNRHNVVLALVLWCILVSTPNVRSMNHDYKDALGKAILFFEGQRSGKLPWTQRVKWRCDSALVDGVSKNVNLSGGYYDAGDNVKFGWPMAYTVALLSWAAIEYSEPINSVSQLDYLRSEIRWGADYILKAHVSANKLYTQVGDGNKDHACWERPEDMDTPRTVIEINTSTPGTEVAADSAAALAAASIVFKGVDPKYSSRLLKHSKSLFRFGDKYRGSYQGSCPFYCSYSGYHDELLWAAAWLHKASGERRYLNYAISHREWSQPATEFSWDNKFAGAQTLFAKEYFSGKHELETFKRGADSFVCAIMPNSGSTQIRTTPGGLLYTRDSSNFQYASSASMVLLVYSLMIVEPIQCGSTKFTPAEIKSFAKSQVDYILGNNPMKMSYMVGYGDKYPTQLHHRGASIDSVYNHPAKVGCNDGYSSYFSSSKPNPNIHVGAIVGGPNSNDGFSDTRSDYSHLEPTTYMNAAFVGSVAAFLHDNFGQLE
ncbi:endoglucanase [Artemisia annua]|uniref:Endoglucanase n=1 Tax=Artemisia annua TaxID=35608 RepID=A0A2U1L9U8_ARTAN|nr:endoglucanase [Artemisia annua]